MTTAHADTAPPRVVARPREVATVVLRRLKDVASQAVGRWAAGDAAGHEPTWRLDGAAVPFEILRTETRR
jgi:hypothetical protein